MSAPAALAVAKLGWPEDSDVEEIDLSNVQLDVGYFISWLWYSKKKGHIIIKYKITCEHWRVKTIRLVDLTIMLVQYDFECIHAIFTPKIWVFSWNLNNIDMLSIQLF